MKSKTRPLGLSVLDRANLYGTLKARRPAKPNSVRLRKKASGKYYAKFEHERLDKFTSETFQPCARNEHDACSRVTLNYGEVPAVCDCACHVVRTTGKRKQRKVLETTYNRLGQTNGRKRATKKDNYALVGRPGMEMKADPALDYKALCAKYAEELENGKRLQKQFGDQGAIKNWE